MFNDLGFTLNPDSMVSFQTAVFPLLLGSFLIIIGNTGFPCMLRLVIWFSSLFIPKSSAVWEELRFLLDHPRRCFTLLFPSKATWWLFWILVLLNGIDVIFFIILDVSHQKEVLEWRPKVNVPSVERLRCDFFGAWNTCPRWVLSSRIHQNCRICRRESIRIAPCHSGFLSRHDVCNSQVQLR